MTETSEPTAQPPTPEAATPAASDGVARPGELIRCAVSDSFAAWMAACGGSLAVTTYQAGKLALVGWDGRKVTLLLREFPRPLGLAVRGGAGPGQVLALATRSEVVLLADAPLLAGDYARPRGRHDALFLPRASYYTGEINAHDLAYDRSGQLWVVNTRFSCLCTPSDRFSFVPRWKPPFVSELSPEDRCHLNGLAVGPSGAPQFVTALGTTDSTGGWRENKAIGGVLLDVDSGQAILGGLCMPHSPRWHADRLWFLNSGAGELCVADGLTGASAGRYSVVCALPGYPRGMCFVGADWAVVALSQVREKHVFGGLPVQARNKRLLCGLAVVDLRAGSVAGVLEFTAGCQELFEVQYLPGAWRPMVLSAAAYADPYRQGFTAPDFAYWATRPQLCPGTDSAVR